MKGFPYGQRKPFQILDQKIMLGAGACDAYNIYFLKGVVADEMSMYLPGNGDDGNGVGIGCRQSCHNIRGAGAGRDQTNSDPSRSPCVSVGGMGSSLLVPDQDMPKILVPIEIMINIQHGSARIAENDIHTFTFQAFKKNARTCHLHVDHILQEGKNIAFLTTLHAKSSVKQSQDKNAPSSCPAQEKKHFNTL